MVVALIAGATMVMSQLHQHQSDGVWIANSDR
jgi:hypothetical protein